MEDIEIKKLNNVQLKQVSVAYIISHPEEIPKGSEKLVEKLIKYDTIISSIMRTIREAENAVTQLKPKADQTMGSIETLIDLISDFVSEEKALEHAKKYKSEKNARPNASPQSTAKAPIVVPDMAGSTAKQYNNENPVKSGA